MATKRGEKEVPTQDGWREPPCSVDLKPGSVGPEL